MNILRLARRLVWVMAIVTVFATAAAADKPFKAEGTFPVAGTLTGVCAFDITVSGTMNVTYFAFVDKSGLTRKEQYHIVEQDTFTANGHSLTGVPFTFNATWLYDSSGNLTHLFADGIVEKVWLPDGSLFISAGRVDFVAHGFPDFILIPDNGATVNLEGFCAALAP